MSGDRGDIVDHYESVEEEARLASGAGRIELLRTQEVLRRHLPPAPAKILDVGGGTGVHASWLADEGYSVHVIDLAPRHVRLAAERLGSKGVTAEVGDARDLPVPDAACDAVLLLGPLYHLVDRADRLSALREAVRAVRPGGVVAVGAISRFASLFDGLARGFLFDPAFRRIVADDLASGVHRNPDQRPHWFTTAYFHRPEELAEEVAEAGLDVRELVGLEGLAGWLPELADRLEDPDALDSILYSARALESEPGLAGLSGHLLLVGSGSRPRTKRKGPAGAGPLWREAS